jgi:hypothetical protein
MNDIETIRLIDEQLKPEIHQEVFDKINALSGQHKLKVLTKRS